MTYAHTKLGTVVGDFRVPRRFKKAVHWVDRRGEIACGTPLSADQIADGRLQDDIGVVTCASCCKAIELDRQKDFFGRPKVREPEPVNWGPLFQSSRRCDRAMARYPSVMRSILLLAALCLSSCSAPDPLARIASTPPTPVSEVLQTGLVRKALHATLGPVQSRGHCRLILPKSTCRWPESALPYVYVAPGEPRAGREFAADFVTRACRPFEDEPIALLLSFGRADAVDLTQFGHRDCWLVTRPDYILTADGGSVLFSPEPGRLSLRFTPPPDWAGVYVSMQAIVQTSRGPAGWAVGPGVEVTFGTAQ